MTQKKGAILIILSTILFGSYGMWAKLIGDSFGVFFQSWSRALIIVIILLPILIWKKQIVAINKKDYGWLALFLFFTSLTQVFIFYAFNHMDIGTATLLVFVSTLLMMYIVGLLFLEEKLTWLKGTSFILAIIGMYIIFSFSLSKFSILAAIFAIISGTASGGELSFSKKLSGNYSALYLCGLSWLIIFLTNLPFSFLFNENFIIPSLNSVWLYQLGFTVASLFGFWLVIKGLEYIESSVGGLLGLLEIIFSILFGILIFNEALSPKLIIGGIFIILSAALPHASHFWSKKRKKYPL